VKCSGLLFPALLTKISKRLIFFSTFSNSFKFVTSQTNDELEPLVFFIILLTLSKSDLVLLIITTFAPASASAIAQAFPTPFSDQVIKAVLFF